LSTGIQRAYDQSQWENLEDESLDDIDAVAVPLLALAGR
jgi:hypothetical protein